MKVGILTFPNSTSYGATLQMYALFRAVSDLGNECEIINYYNAFMRDGRHTSRTRGTNFIGRAKYYIRSLMHLRLERGFRGFEKNNVPLYPIAPFSDMAELKNADVRYDAVICGSDQVWNPKITDSDLSYFLDFCSDNTRRIAYAPSFGIDELESSYEEKVGAELKKFHALSIREESGRKIACELTGRQCQIVLDPTMLHGLDAWEKLETKTRLAQGDYILYFTVRTSSTLLEYAKSLSKVTGKKIIIVGGNQIIKMKNKDRMIEYAIDPSPSEWLNLVHNAAYIVTNSFHGTAFSIIYRKNFYVGLPSFAPSRLRHLLSTLGLSDRIINGTVCDGVSSADYTEAEVVLPKLIAESMEYLKIALQED